MKTTIEDLSYSGLVNLIQNDKHLAAQTITCILREKLELEQEAEKLRIELLAKRARIDLLEKAPMLITKHLEYTLPLAIIYNEVLIIVSERGATIEHNFIKV